MSYVDFETNGTVNNDGTVTLGLDQYIRPLTDAASQFLAKACLTVTYNGSIKIVMGDKFTSGYGYSSSGATITRQATTYFLEAVPTFTIYGNTGNGTVISQLSFCASKC